MGGHTQKEERKQSAQKKGLKKQKKSFQKGRKLRGEGKGSKEGQQKGQKGRSDASGWQRWSGRPSRRSRYTQRQRLVGVRGRCPVSTQHDSEVHGRGVRGTEGRSLECKHREMSLPLAIPEPALVVDGRRGRRGLRAKGEAHQAGNLQAACDGDGTRAITTCNRGWVRRWRVAPGEHHRRPAGKLSG